VDSRWSEGVTTVLKFKSKKTAVRIPTAYNLDLDIAE
jgi:hypothetical protein